MMKKILMVAMLFVMMAVSVSAFSVVNNNPVLTKIGSGTVSGTMTLTNNEPGDITVTGNNNIRFSDFNSTVTYSPSPIVIPGNGSVTVTYQLNIPKNVAGRNDAVLNLTDGTTVRSMNVGLQVTQLELSKLDVRVGSRVDRNIEDEGDGYEINAEGRPGDMVTVSMRLDNLFSNNRNDPIDGRVEIELFEVFLIVEDMDDRDDIEVDLFDIRIRADSRETIDLEFQIPWEADSGFYDMVLEIDAEDENGNDMSIFKYFELNVERERYKGKIMDSRFSQSLLACDRITTANIEVMNIGDRDLSRMNITVSNAILGISESVSGLTLESGSYDSSRYTARIPISISDDARSGTYVFDVRAYYDNERLTDAGTMELRLEQCRVEEPSVPVPPKNDTVVIIVPNQTVQDPVVRDPVVAEPVVTPGTAVKVTESFTESPMFIVFLVILNIVIIALVVWLIARFLLR